MIDFVIKYWVQLAAIASFGIAILRAVIKKKKQEKEEQEALKEGVLALLHDRLYQGCRFHIREKQIEAAELKNMEYLYNGYHTLGGNGTGTELYERVKDLPLKEDKK